jgi:hypothetical protein
MLLGVDRVREWEGCAVGGIYRVARGATADPYHDNLEVIYGWAPLHRLIRILEAGASTGRGVLVE